MRDRPQTLRNPQSRISEKPHTARHSLANQARAALRNALESAPATLLRHALSRLPRQIAETVSDSESERLARDEEAGLHVGDSAVVGYFIAPETRQRMEAFGRRERTVD